MIDFAFCVPSLTNIKSSSSSLTFNKQMIDGHDMWTTIPEELSPSHKIISITDMTEGRVIIPEEDIFREGKLVRISESSINKTIGLHSYEIKLQSIYTGDLIYSYIKYRIQDDEPETPYIYMNREGE